MCAPDVAVNDNDLGGVARTSAVVCVRFDARTKPRSGRLPVSLTVLGTPGMFTGVYADRLMENGTVTRILGNVLKFISRRVVICLYILDASLKAFRNGIANLSR